MPRFFTLRRVMVALGSNSPTGRVEKRRLTGLPGSQTGLATMLVVLALQAPALAAPGKSPEAERASPANRATTAEAHYELGVLYHERMFADLDQAIAEYEQAVKLRDDFAEAHYHLGLSYHTKARVSADDKVLYRKALKEYKVYLKYLPKGPLAQKAQQNMKAVQSRLR